MISPFEESAACLAPDSCSGHFLQEVFAVLCLGAAAAVAAANDQVPCFATIAVVAQFFVAPVFRHEHPQCF